MNPLSTTVNVPATANAGAAVPAASAAAQDGGEAGAFALLLGCFTAAPALAPCAGEDSVTSNATALEAEIAAALAMTPAVVANEAGDAVRAEDAITASLPDAALVASLLGQLQTPYATVTTALPPDPAAVTARSGSTPHAAGPLTAPLQAAAAAAAASAAALDMLQTAAAAPPTEPPLDNATATPAPAAHPATAPVPDHHNMARSAMPPALAPAGAANSASHETAAVHDAAMNLDQRAAAALADASAAAHTGSARRSEGAAGAQHNGNATAAHSQLSAEFRRVPDTLPALEMMHDAGAEVAQIAAAPAALSAAAAARSHPRHEALDRGSDLSSVAAATPAPFVHHSDSAPRAVTIAPPVQSPEWHPAFANSVKLLVHEGTSSATLQLNPAEFGPIDVRIVISEQRADISFMVAHPEANTAIRDALSDLRDQLARSGIQLGQTSVGTHPQPPRQSPPALQRTAAPRTTAVPQAGDPSPLQRRTSGSIDIYA